MNIQIWFLSLAIAFGCGFYFMNFDKTVLTVLIISGFLLFLTLLLTKPNWFYFLVIGFIPISFDTSFIAGSKMSIPSEGMLVVLLGVFFLFHKNYWKAIRRIVFHPISILIWIDLIVQLITTFTSTHIDVSMKRIVIKLLYLLFFFVAVNMIDKPKHLVYVFVIYSIGLIPVMFFTLMNHSKYNFDPRVVFEVCAPYFNDHTVYGACLAFIIPLLLLLVKFWSYFFNSKKWRFAFTILLLFIVASEIMALSRAAILSLIFAGIFSVLLRIKVQFKTLLITLAIFIIAVTTGWNSIYKTFEKNKSVSNDGIIVNHFSSVSNIRTDASNLERINRWICAVRMFEEKPLFGFGPGAYQFEYNRYQTSENKTYISTNLGDLGNAHSEYLTYLSENGIFGFSLFVLTVFAALYYGMRNHYTLDEGILKVLNLGILLGLMTFFFHGIFNMFIDQIEMASLVYSALGIIVWINLYQKRILKEEIKC